MVVAGSTDEAVARVVAVDDAIVDGATEESITEGMPSRLVAVPMSAYDLSSPNRHR